MAQCFNNATLTLTPGLLVSGSIAIHQNSVKLDLTQLSPTAQATSIGATVVTRADILVAPGTVDISDLFAGTFPFTLNNPCPVFIGDVQVGTIDNLQWVIVYTEFRDVTFQDWDGTDLGTQTVKYGSAASAPADPSRAGYRFIGWDTDFSQVTATITATAQYVQQHTVTFVDWDGAPLDTQAVDHGSSASAPADPARKGYRFTGWSVDYSNITAPLTVTAQYVQQHTVTFVDWDGSVLDTQAVDRGSSASAPADPIRPGYNFTGWDTSFDTVNADLTVTALYDAIITTYPSQWLSGNTYTKGSNTNLNLSSEHPFDVNARVLIDGVEASRDKVLLSEGSTVATFTAAYLETLSPGYHHVVLRFADDTSSTNTFRITAAQATGGTDSGAKQLARGTKLASTDDATPLSALVVCTGVALCGVVIMRKRLRG